MMDKYYIGEIDANTVPTKRKYVPPQLQFLVPLLILGLAFAVRTYTKKE
ncbi:unnamed protein product [Linum tenue]|uniref:Uncharacterized protein n=1 Tax=Linum tenue TaxID=586396 RepID=A0AAV0N217_9ROSI|nr:unnamed protein product [Linum tenue]CAI0544682.1 unnamed protein product [Linum tenue]